MTERRSHEAAIEKWMLSVINEGGVERFDDLHVDQIDKRWRSRKFWIEASASAFPIAVRLRDERSLPFTVALAFSLRARGHAGAVSLRSASELLEAVDWSPPSLYLFHKGQEPWGRSDLQGVQPGECLVLPVDASAVFGGLRYLAAYLVEFGSASPDDRYRTFFIAG
jgi:hypothetical protein